MLEIPAFGRSALHKLVQAATQNRTTRALDVAMDEGIARTHIGDLPEDLTTYLHIVARITSTLSEGYRAIRAKQSGS